MESALKFVKRLVTGQSKMGEKVNQDRHLTIKCLPEEIITTILMSNEISVSEVLKFGQTCRYYYEMVRHNQVLWRRKVQLLMPATLLELIPLKDCDWLKEFKYFYLLKKTIHAEIGGMSAKYYWREAPISPGDIKIIFEYALERPLGYFYTITILFKLMSSCKHTNRQTGRPYCLINLYYAGVVSKYLIHMFLMVKWQHMITTESAVPENIVNFFLQWIDTKNVYYEVENQHLLDLVVAEVEKSLPECEPLRKVPVETRALWATKPLKDNVWDMETSLRIHAAIKLVIYQDKTLILTNELDNKSLSLAQVEVEFQTPGSLPSKNSLELPQYHGKQHRLCSRLGSLRYVVTGGTFYEAVARRCGLRCELVSFHDHFLLEWRESYSRVTPVYHIDLSTGEVEAKRTCPFANGANRTDYFYTPEALVRYLYNSLSKSSGYNQVRYSKNAVKLLDFLEMDNGASVLYKQYLPFLKTQQNILKTMQPICLKDMQPSFATIVLQLLDLHTHWDTIERPRAVKKHPKEVKYAVGMICHHKEYNYLCVIRDWDSQCMASAEWQERMSLHTLYGSNQPFYVVLAVDHSELYVAQENLVLLSPLTGIAAIEDEISKDFCHFDGNFYVPNVEKQSEYPEDGKIREKYRRCDLVLYGDEQGNINGGYGYVDNGNGTDDE